MVVNGALESVATAFPFTSRSTVRMAALSDAVAETVTDCPTETVMPSAGLVSCTAGGVVSRRTGRVMLGEEPWNPPKSFATACSVTLFTPSGIRY